MIILNHKSHNKMVTVTAVHPGARFGELEMNGNKVSFVCKLGCGIKNMETYALK